LDFVHDLFQGNPFLGEAVAVADRHAAVVAVSPSTVMQNGVPISSCRR
jgi:hypothetical protein